MQGPLPTTPRTAFMDGTACACTVKDAVVINDLHLNTGAVSLPIAFLHFLRGEAEAGNHSGLIFSIKGNGAVALAAKAAADTGKNI